MIRKLFLSLLLVHVLSMTSVEAAPVKLPALRASANAMHKDIGAWLQKLPQKALKVGTVAAAAVVVACGGLTMAGCSESGKDQVIEHIHVEEHIHMEEYIRNDGTDAVAFYLDGVLHEGYWEVTPDGQLLIAVDDGYGTIVLLEHMTGKIIPRHSDIGAEVIVHGIGDNVDEYGTVLEVYDNGFYIILIDANETLLISMSVLPEEGGFEFLEE